MKAYDVQVPEVVSDWVGSLLWILIALALLWAALTTIGYIKRRAYNLSGVESAGKKDIKPDFLKVDQAARQEQIKRGDAFTVGKESSTAGLPPQIARALSLTRIAGTFAAVASFISAVAFAFDHIEVVEAMWQKYSPWERFAAIIQEYPVGFSFAAIIILAAFLRMIVTLRGNP